MLRHVAHLLCVALLLGGSPWAHPKPPAGMKNRVTPSFRIAELVYVTRELTTVRLRGVPPQEADAENEMAYNLGLLAAASDQSGTSCSSPGPEALRHEFLLEHVPASGLVTILERLHPQVAFELHPIMNGFYAYGSRPDFKEIARELTVLDIAADPHRIIQETMLLKYDDREEIKSLLGALVPDLKVAFDGENPNVLHLEGTPGALEQARELLDSSLPPPDQIVFECKLLHFSDLDQRDLPIHWTSSPWVGQEKESVCFRDTICSGENHSTPIQSGLVNRQELTSFLMAQKETHVLASPRMAITSGQPGIIHILDKFPWIYLDWQSGEFEADRQDLGLKLSIECTLLPNKRIRCRIQGDFTSLEELLAGHYPRLRRLTFKGQTDLDDGQTLVLAGLTTTEKLQAAGDSVPLLRDLPIQGQLFRDLDRPRHVYLTITPWEM